MKLSQTAITNGHVA